MVSFIKSQQVRPGATLLLLSLMLGLILGLAGCAGNPPPKPAASESGQTVSNGTTQQPRINTAKLNQRGLLGIAPGDRAQFVDPNNPLSTRTIYFDYDSDNIKPEFRAAVRAHAGYLANHPNTRLRLEGHTDKRGTREYNIALGERRADSVKQALVIDGASPGQITTLSFGEEQPAVLGDTEAAYAKNRRVVLIYVPH